MELQNKTLTKQNFENTFFQMVSLYNEICISFTASFSNNHFNGRGCFKVFYRRLCDAWNRAETNRMQGLEEVRFINFVFEKYQNDSDYNLGHYFRNIENIILFIDRSDVKEKNFYASIVKAQFSNEEMLILFYYGLKINGQDTIKNLIEKYGLLRNISISSLIKQDHYNLYADSAYI